MSNKINTDDLLEEALLNARDEIALIKVLVLDIVEAIGTDRAAHATIGLVASKYFETLQRSNEQILKIASQSKLRKTKAEEKEEEEEEAKEKEKIYEDFEAKQNGQ